MKLSDVKVSGLFKVAGIEFIKFSQDGNRTVAVAKDSLFNSAFGDDNNFAKSKILKRLQEDVLPKIEAEVGAENVLEFETDLLSLDGSDLHGKVTSKIGLPTFDFYRQNVKVFDEHKLDAWWWLATPDTTEEHVNNHWVVCVSPRGCIIYGGYFHGNSRGVRPFLIFESSISVSNE